jgi:hypothetical protein
VTFISGNTNVLTVSGSTATIRGAGNVSVTATNSGGNGFAPSGASRSVTISKANQTISFTNLPAIVTFRSNGVIPLGAKNSSGLSVTYTSSKTNVLQIVGTNAVIKGRGTNTITASQTGNTNYLAASNVVRTIVVK